jgi:hypothetical protein
MTPHQHDDLDERFDLQDTPADEPDDAPWLEPHWAELSTRTTGHFRSQPDGF